MSETPDLKTKAINVLEEARIKANLGKREFEDVLDGALDRASETYAKWDAALEERFEARLGEATTKLQEWKARAAKESAEFRVKAQDSMAKLEEEVALGRARLAEWQRARHEKKAEEALHEAAKHFDEAYDAAKRHA